MKRKAASRMMLALLLTSMLSLTISIPSAKASSRRESELAIFSENLIPAPPDLSSTNYEFYHFLGARTFSYTHSVGICAEIQVTDPEVRRVEREFFAAWIMVHRYSPNRWIQVGWMEGGWKDDRQYIFVFDTQHNEWHTYPQYAISPSTWIRVSITYQGGSTWAASLWWNDEWILLDTADIGFSPPMHSSQFGEIFTYDDHHFFVPDTHFYNVSLQLDGGWILWESFLRTAEYNADVPYDTRWLNKYWDWYMHTNVVEAAAEIDPNTLNLKNRGRWITSYIQLPEGYSPEDIDATTILLNKTIQPILDSKYGFVSDPGQYLVDHNEDGILERLVKFDKASVEQLIHNQGIPRGEAMLTITGELHDHTLFRGTDAIFVNYAEFKHGD